MILKSRVMLVLFAAAAANSVAQTKAWEFSHPDAKLLLGIDLKSLRESAVGQSFREQMKTQPAQTGSPSPLQAPFQAMALGLLEQIDRVFLSSPANVAASAKKDPPFLLVVEGTLPMAEIKPFLNGPSRKYRTAEIYRTSKTETTSVALLEGGTLLLGDERSVLAAIDRRGRALPPESALQTRARTLASTHDFWVIADAPLSKFQPAGTSVSNPLASQMASQIKGMDFGLSLRDGFQFELSLTAESDAAAAQMTQLLSTQIQMATLAQANRPEAVEIARKLHIGAEGNRMRVDLALTKDEFEQQLKAVQTARAKAAASLSLPVARQTQPASPGKIMIYGLDEGPREVRTTH